MSATVSRFVEVADRVWVARYPWFDVNVTLVGGDGGLVVVDTHGSTRAGSEVVEDVRRLGVGDVTAVVNTHEHFDHVFGNDAFLSAYGTLPVHAHEVAAEQTLVSAEATRARYAEDPDDPHAAEVLETRVVPADHTFSSVRVLELGDRRLELLHLGRGHTGGDLVVHVPDADVVLAGDLVEESGPPAFGEESFPLDWPFTLDQLIGLTGPATRVVPGHGALVDRAFVEAQRADLGTVAQQIHELAAEGVPVDRALEARAWPFPTSALSRAMRAGYAQLPREARGLPLA
ncbi:MAG: MBL fold metallo-hydrolase [Nocardioidaceae bacterium]